MLVDYLLILSLIFVVWQSEQAISVSTSETPFLIRVALVMICVGGAAMLWVEKSAPWPPALLAVGTAVLLAANRRSPHK